MDTDDSSREDEGPREASADPTVEGGHVTSHIQGLGGARNGTGCPEADDVSVRYGESRKLVEVDDTETIFENPESERVEN